MKTFILVGEQAINNFQEESWSDFQADILMNYTGDIVAWNKETDDVTSSPPLNKVFTIENYRTDFEHLSGREKRRQRRKQQRKNK